MDSGDTIITRKRRNRSDNKDYLNQREQSTRLRRLREILEKNADDRNEEERQILEESSGLIPMVESKLKKALVLRERNEEKEDPPEILREKCLALAQVIKSCHNLIIYSGAGISTSAKIPDYRGPNGVWTQLSRYKRIVSANMKDLVCAEPTYTHMALVELHRRGILKYVVSQNCDGLHLRSGLPLEILSEIHGNMYAEVCLNCKKLYWRDFDVTEKTSFHRHRTGRKCHRCPPENAELTDTIVHFGEKARSEKPYNWENAGRAVEACKIILCLGSSLKILRSYRCLWPRKSGKKPDLYIVNLQWTPKDSQATLKINGKCDDVMKIVMDYLAFPVPKYKKESDPLLRLHTPLRDGEEDTCNRLHLKTYEANSSSVIETETQSTESFQPGWFGRGLKPKRK